MLQELQESQESQEEGCHFLVGRQGQKVPVGVLLNGVVAVMVAAVAVVVEANWW